MKGCECAS